MAKAKKRRWWIIPVAVLAVLALVLAVNHNLVRVIYYNNVDPENKIEVANWTGGKTYEKVPYSEVSENDYLHLFVPDGVENPPLLVIVHGGGFVYNDLDSRQAQLMYHYFRDHGYACATVNYRLAQEAQFPAAVQDVKAAVRFLRANAGTYGYNADRIAIFGESAGGYLAVMASVTNEDEFNDVPFIGEEALEEPVSAKISAILDYYGCMVLESQAERHAEFKTIGIPDFVVSMAEGWLSSAVKDFPDYTTVEDYFVGASIANLSQEERNVFLPMYYAEKNLGPDSDLDVLILHGDVDLSVPYTQSQRLQALLKDTLGEEHVTLRMVRNAKHAAERLYTDAVLGDVKAWLDGVIG